MKKNTKPLAQSDPDHVWEPRAKELGITVEKLRTQIKLADDIIEELIAEEKFYHVSPSLLQEEANRHWVILLQEGNDLNTAENKMKEKFGDDMQKLWDKLPVVGEMFLK